MSDIITPPPPEELKTEPQVEQPKVELKAVVPPVEQPKPEPVIELLPPEQPRRRGMVKAAVVAVSQFFITVVKAPLAFVRKRKKTETVVVYSAPASFYLWFMIVVGFASAYLVNRNILPPTIGGWSYIWATIFFVSALIWEVNTWRMVIWAGVFALIWLASKYIEFAQNVVVLGWIFRKLAGMNPQLDPGFAEVMSFLWLLPWVGSVIYMIFNGRKQFTPNGISEYHFGEGNELTDRVGLKFKTQYRDLLESALTFGGGDLVAYDNQHTVIKRWNSIIGLYWIWPDLDRILHQRSVVETNEEDE